MARIYYVGDWAVLNGPVFAESPFNYGYKGLEIFNYGKWLKDALESSGKHEVISVPSWDFYRLGPGEYEKILATHDLIIFSDVEAKLFQLAPNFFDREKFGREILTFPDRIRLTIEAVKAGKSIMFLGGWLSFNGEMGKGGWGRTMLKEILPVECLEYEDLIESTEGFSAVIQEDWARKFNKIDFTTMPPILGYNKTLPREGFDVVLEIRETGDPLLAYGAIGRGNVLAYMSDPAPHWGCNFVFWKNYNQFWLNCVDLILN
jgi:uncharacterized membrane protein